MHLQQLRESESAVTDSPPATLLLSMTWRDSLSVFTALSRRLRELNTWHNYEKEG